MPLPQSPPVPVQSSSLVSSQVVGQQASASTHAVTRVWEQAALQLLALPVMVSSVHGLWSSQVSGQLPSQVSPGSTVPSPQVPEQSESLVSSQPAGQQPSASTHEVTTWEVQTTLQLAALPVIESTVQALPSSQVTGQLPSQVSGGSTVPLPQVAEHSASLVSSQPAGQQPSPSVHVSTWLWLQAAEQVSSLPVKMSVVHGLPSSQVTGQSPSQVSGGSTVPLPQLEEQSLSRPEHVDGQHASPSWQAEIDPRLNVVSHDYDARDRRRRTRVHLDRVSNLGQAVTEVPPFMAREGIANGSLIEVLPEYPMPWRTIRLLIVESRAMSPLVREFLNFASEAFTSALSEETDAP